MWSIIEAAGWPIWPLIFASVISVAIIGERLVALRAGKVAPKTLLPEVQSKLKHGGITPEFCSWLEQHSPLGEIFASAVCNSALCGLDNSREVMKEAIEESGRAVTHKLERYLTTLGTIASIGPLLGLLGTVIGMVELFGALGPGSHDPVMLARGISVALYNTAMGLIVAIPSMIFYRYFRGQVDTLVIEMEQQAIKLVELLQGQRK